MVVMSTQCGALECVFILLKTYWVCFWAAIDSHFVLHWIQYACMCVCFGRFAVCLPVRKWAGPDQYSPQDCCYICLSLFMDLLFFTSVCHKVGKAFSSQWHSSPATDLPPCLMACVAHTLIWFAVCNRLPLVKPNIKELHIKYFQWEKSLS